MTLLAVLVAFAILLLVVGIVLLVGVAVLFFVLRRSEPADAQEMQPPTDSPRAPFPDAAAAPPPAPPVPAGLAGNMPSNAGGIGYAFNQEEEEVAKTEVFTRGSLNLDWGEDDPEENATEIFRADEYQLE